MRPQCQKEGCQSFALDSGLCFSHDPAKQGEKISAVTKGGFAPKKVRLDLPPVQIKTIPDVLTLLEDTINRVRNGEMPSSNPANTIGFLCGHVLKALEISELDSKLEVIDQVILERRNQMRGRR